MRRKARFSSLTQNRTERGKVVVEQEKFRHEPRMHVRAVNGLVGVPRAARAQHGRPFERLGLADGRRRAAFGQGLVAHVEDARGLVGAFQELAGLHEPPAFVVDQRGVR